ncbi:MAG: biotin--[acetyl-CoA-carboxylase] ligase [Proteobacteria bacterium]|nr:biotin--[acetyl-CoA-carboxylase] ligase [Pseudomonadota bacterium]MBU1710568.1 biotin--[acetyl-CoA-carboxylase] ligase [Pseudomonadota bacterium]
MGVDVSLSPALVRQIIVDEEIPLRVKGSPRQTVEVVFRYGGHVGSIIEMHESLARGMDHARGLIRIHENEETSFPSGMAILADELTGGKGRFRRSWHAPAGGVWLTLVLVNTLLPETSRLYPLAAGVACCETLRRYDLDATIKWVNDVHVQGRKIAGILAETAIGHLHREEYVLIGIGINVNNTVFPDELAPHAVSLKTILGREADLNLFAARLLAALSWNIGLLHFEEQRLLQESDDRDLQNPADHLLFRSWRKLSDSIGRRVRFGFNVFEKPQFEARVVDLDNSGGLVLKLDDGTTHVEHSGEIVYLD